MQKEAGSGRTFKAVKGLFKRPAIAPTIPPGPAAELQTLRPVAEAGNYERDLIRHLNDPATTRAFSKSPNPDLFRDRVQGLHKYKPPVRDGQVPASQRALEAKAKRLASIDAPQKQLQALARRQKRLKPLLDKYRDRVESFSNPNYGW